MTGIEGQQKATALLHGSNQDRQIFGIRLPFIGHQCRSFRIRHDTDTATENQP
jgi:hypothetical protein